VSQDFLDSFDIDKYAHTTLMTIISDHGTKQGLMAKNITDNFAREVKPQQLRHFFNQHVCHHDNIDLFYAHYIKNVFKQNPQDFYYYNLGVYSPEEIKDKNSWIQKWTRAEHQTFAERFVAFTAAELIFGTTNRCAIKSFEDKKILPGLCESAKLIDRHVDVLEDFVEFVQNVLLIRPASPLTIREIINDAAESEFKYAKSFIHDGQNETPNFEDTVRCIKENADKTLGILGQPPYFQTPTVQSPQSLDV
jgi:ribonucleoside-diphosphate reductase beta chain